jgi:hypothetical protein
MPAVTPQEFDVLSLDESFPYKVNELSHDIDAGL